MVCCSSSMAEKKSIKAFCPGVFVPESDEELASGAFGIGATLRIVNMLRRCYAVCDVPISAGLGLDLIPSLALRSAASFCVLYSILFCSKFESFRYSSSELARETGA